MQDPSFEHLEAILGYRFNNKELLWTALTHKTYAFEAHSPVEYNDRLEFLGDSILNFVIAEQLHGSNRYFSEGELTRRRASLVNNNVLADIAIRLDIGPFLLLGKGEQKQEGEKNRTNLANTLEAIIGALYLDSDLETVRSFILEKIYTKEYQF
ncbi:MAG TPA: ribonuclease III domain-containing protein [Candidatus Thermoplasmatota archaeon]|nr:ribonuclease III domain-containing protein [Candidatus Thermoplasmatota archaeon]